MGKEPGDQVLVLADSLDALFGGVGDLGQAGRGQICQLHTQQFDSLWSSLAQRRSLRDYLQGLLLPRDRNKTLTGLAGAEPITGAQHREVQRLQWFLSESAWDHEQVNDRRVQLLCQDPATAPHDGACW